jgi:hypothetical protein
VLLKSAIVSFCINTQIENTPMAVPKGKLKSSITERIMVRTRAHSFRLYKPIPANMPGSDMIMNMIAMMLAMSERIVEPLGLSINPPTNLSAEKMIKAISKLKILKPICNAATMLMFFFMMLVNYGFVSIKSIK